MGESFYTFPPYEVIPELRDSRTRGTKPFSRTCIERPFSELVQATNVLCNHLIYDRDHTGVTDEELNMLRSLRSKLELLEKQDTELRRKQDLILRCLHPDGCYFPYLPKKVRSHAFEMVGVDPLEGIHGIRIGWPSPEIDGLFEFLQKEVKRLERKW